MNMKKRVINVIAWLLALATIFGAFSACNNHNAQENETTAEQSQSATGTESQENNSEEKTEESTSAERTEDTTTSDAESDTSVDSGEETTKPSGGETTTETNAETSDEKQDSAKVPNKNDAVVELAADKANKVQAYFTDASRTHYSIVNTEMTMTYARSNMSEQLVESIKNTNGVAYIQNTMDVFVRMNNGSTYYASQSEKSAEANLYRFGYYYYEGLFEFQNFISNKYSVSGTTEITEKNYSVGSSKGISRKRDDGTPLYTISNANDPWIVFNGFELDTASNDAITIEAKAIGNTTKLEFYIRLRGGSFNTAHKIDLPLIADGEYHTYNVSLFGLSDFDGVIEAIRIDPAGDVGDGIAIKSLQVGKADLDLESMPSDLAINRHFHVYTDKMHHAVQFATTEKTENIAEVGILTEIDASTVASIIIVTANGKTYSALDAGFAWSDVVAVAFDIKDAGVFGYILPNDEISGNIKVELKDGIYAIEQTRVPVAADGSEGVILPSVGGVNADGNLIHAAGVKNNGNDFYIGQRIYTDENHDFGEFLKETNFERNPLNDKRVNVSSSESDNASYLGYDAMRGIYVFKVATPSGGFYTPYNAPNKNYKVNFSIRSDIDREIYVMTTGTQGLLECAALMDDKMMLLPVPIEVIKNFSEKTGERNLFNIDDVAFSEAIFCLPLSANTKQEYTILNLYQNWGNYPLKQISQIPYHMPYYHLSTGVTETNCIVPWFGTDNVAKGSLFALPDFRSMSAPLWKDQPQHNSCGSHQFLTYYDENGKRYAVESIYNEITSFGPTYAEVIWDNISDDGKIKVTYTHMEMPQTDENRTYYTIEYKFLEDLTITDFKNNFQFYSVTDNDGAGSYKKIGYLNAENKIEYVDSNQDEETTPEYVLGNDAPYFSFFMMPDWDKSSTSAQGYANVAFLIYNSDFTVNGEKQDYDFLIKNPKDYVVLTLNVDGEIAFKAGDSVTINAILLPWGSQELEDGIENAELGNYEYDTVLDDGTLYMDKNVRDVRENTIKNPLKVTSDTDTVIESTFVPKVKSKDGKVAEFTLSGGENNVAVRIYGFERLTAPRVEEYVNGKWVEYTLSSKNNPDKLGYYHYYDGYMVHYDEDGTYSYSFVTTMNGGESRRFRIYADREFADWPTEILPTANPDFLDVYIDHEEINTIIMSSSHMFGESVLTDTDEGKYISVFGNSEKTEAFVTLFSDPTGATLTGKYLVIKYRVPATNKESVGHFELWSSTVFEKESAAETGSFKHTPIADGEWHIDVIDLSKSGLKSFSEGDDGNYCATFLRMDIFNVALTDPETHIDLAYVGIASELIDICELEREEFKTVTLYEGKALTEIDTATGEKYQKQYIDPESGYVKSEVAFGAVIDFVSGIPYNTSSATSLNGVTVIYDSAVTSNYTLVIQGWCAADGGIDKYVYSIDGGKTWIEISGKYLTPSGTAIVEQAQKKSGKTFADLTASNKNSSFQKGATGGLVIDLSAFKGETVDLVLAAVPAGKENELIVLYSFEDVKCSVSSIFDEESKYTEISVPYGSILDTVNGVTFNKSSSTTGGLREITDTVTAASDNTLTFKGWCVINGGTNKYVWTADNGKTWHEFGGTLTTANDNMISYGQTLAGTTFGQPEQTKKNGCFAGNYSLIMDLSSYTGSNEPLTIYDCAVPESDLNTVVLLYHFDNVVVK